eukprot:GDKH01000305.1.p1 GENE.GDKH01000305.1~~GDKH01000305.1.p1  ORF type:complete len:365 (-),score=50.81 GDKH01000305.1:78-1172(-)
MECQRKVNQQAVDDTVREANARGEVLAKKPEPAAVLTIPRHCPTRWGITVAIMKRIALLRKAFKALETHAGYLHAKSKGGFGETRVADFERAVFSEAWFTRLDHVIQVTRPVNDQIHILEGDNPRLSEAVSPFRFLEREFTRWVNHVLPEAHRASDGPKLLRLLVQKRDLVLHDATYLARLLDPLFWRELKDDFGGYRMSAISHAKLEAYSPDEYTKCKDVLQRIVLPHQREAAQEELVKFTIADLSEYKTWVTQFRATELDPKTGLQKRKCTVEHRRSFWAKVASTRFPVLAFACQKLLTVHITSASAERNWSKFSTLCSKFRSQLKKPTVEALVFLQQNYNADDDIERELELFAEEDEENDD